MKKSSASNLNIDDRISLKIKYLYLILTIGIVMYHARWLYDFNIEYLNVFDRKCLSFYFKIAEHIGYVCMTFFFFMSAFWFYAGVNNIKDVLNKLKKRFFTLFVPFILWSIIILIYKVCNNQIVISLNNVFYYFFETPVAGPLWYILGILILQLFAPFVILMKKNKKLLTLIFGILILYVNLRHFGLIPELLTFNEWWWYENLIVYSPVYLIGAYIGLYYPNIVIKKEYKSKKYTYITIIIFLISFFFWYYSLMQKYDVELIGIWFILKPNLFKKNIPKILNCNFYIFALHNPILIPKTRELLKLILQNHTVFGLEVVLIKIIQIIVVVLASIIIKFLVRQIFSEKINYYLTGGR